MIKKPEGIIPPVCVLSVVIQLSTSTRQRHIPHRHNQPPDQDETSDDSSQNEVQHEQGDPAAQRAAARYDPETQPPDAERQPAEYP